MTNAGTSRWARYGKFGAVIAFVVAVVVGAANIDGFLSLLERVFGSDDPPNSVVEASPPTGATSTTAEPFPTGTATTDSTEPPATPEVETAIPRQTTTLPKPAPPTRGGALVITIKMGSGGKIGP